MGQHTMSRNEHQGFKLTPTERRHVVRIENTRDPNWKVFHIREPITGRFQSLPLKRGNTP